MLRRAFLTLVLCLRRSGGVGDRPPLVTAVDSIGMTVSDLDRSVEFYSKVLSFEKVSETEVDGSDYEHLEGVFGLRMRTARMRLGDEFIELTEFLAPTGRPAPAGHASQRSLVPAHRHHHQRHGSRLQAAAGEQGAARVVRSAASARLEQERRRHPGVLFPRSGRPLSRGAGVSAGQGKCQVASRQRTSCFSE